MPKAPTVPRTGTWCPTCADFLSGTGACPECGASRRGFDEVPLTGTGGARPGTTRKPATQRVIAYPLPEGEEGLTSAEAAELLGVTPHTARGFAREGKLVAYTPRQGRGWRFLRADVEALAEWRGK